MDTPMYNVLIVDDDELSRYATRRILKDRFHLFEAESKADCMKVLQKKQVHVVVLDLLMPHVDGFELLEWIKAQYPDIAVVILTGVVDVKKSVAALKLKASDYILKDDAALLLLESVMGCCEQFDHRIRFEGLKYESEQRARDCFIPDHPAYTTVFSRALKAANRELSVLITGETGTGKDVLARHVRQLVCPNGPFICVNCGAIPESLAEAELFGYEKNAFNDAPKRLGKLELSNNGVLFLDEIGTMPLAIQQKFLRALENRTIMRIGSEKEIDLNFLLVCATNVDLEAEVAAGRFREDLFYRIRDVQVQMPSLRDVPEVIDQFVDYFVAMFNAKYGESFQATPDVYAHFHTNMTGNVRHIKKEIQTMVALNEGPTKRLLETVVDAQTLDEKLAAIERQWIASELAVHKSNISATARALGVKRSTLFERMKKLAIVVEK